MNSERKQWLAYWKVARDLLVNKYLWKSKRADKLILNERLWYERRKVTKANTEPEYMAECIHLREGNGQK